MAFDLNQKPIDQKLLVKSTKPNTEYLFLQNKTSHQWLFFL